MPGPMEGVRVVEMGFWVAAPSAATILADWGAEVVKIEPPTGDPMRGLTGNALFDLDNRGKRGVVLDLSTRKAREITLSLIERADVFVTNMRPVILEGWGFDHETLTARFPRLVYAGITAYGREGADRDRPAYDYGAFWARSGLANALTPDGAEHPPIQRGGMGDHMTGMATAGGVSAALYERSRTGRGQLVSVSLLRVGIYQLGQDMQGTLRMADRPPSAGPAPARPPAAPGRYPGGRSSAFNPLFSCYRDAEGRWFWLLGLQGDRHWPDIARAIGHPEWIEDERFAGQAARGRNAVELRRLLDEVFATMPLVEWGPIFDAGDVWWAPVQNTLEVVRDPQSEAAGAWIETPSPDGNTVRMVATPVDFSGRRLRPQSPVPELGQHTEEVLQELGYDWDAIGRLKEDGVIP